MVSNGCIRVSHSFVAAPAAVVAGGWRFSFRSAVSIKENAMRPQITDQCLEVVRQFLIIQHRREHSFAVRRILHHFGRSLNRFAGIVNRHLEYRQPLSWPTPSVSPAFPRTSSIFLEDSASDMVVELR